MRPLKYKNLGEMRIMRVPELTSNLIPQLNEIMNQLEESGKNSVEEVNKVLEFMSDNL